MKYFPVSRGYIHSIHNCFSLKNLIAFLLSSIFGKDNYLLMDSFDEGFSVKKYSEPFPSREFQQVVLK